MPEIFTSRTEGQGYYYIHVMEDPNPSQNRIFIDKLAHDVTTLQPQLNKYWHYTWQDYHRQFSTAWDRTYGPMLLEKGTINAYGDGDYQHYDCCVSDTYHQTLDFANWPVKKAWQTSNGLIWWHSPGKTIAASTDCYSRVFQTGADCTGGANAATDYIYGMPTSFFWEDTVNNRLWTFHTMRTEYHEVRVQSNYNPQSPATAPTSYIGPASYRGFFMGLDNNGWPWFCYSADAAYSAYYIYKVDPVSLGVTTILSNSYTANTNNWQKSWPSNIRTVSSTRKVFYSSHYNTNGELIPIRYEWNPTTGTITTTTCTMTYPSGNYTSYASRITAEQTNTTTFGDSNLRMSWRIKGHQFTVGGTNYITYWICDKSAAFGMGTTRCGSLAKRTMITYTIGSGTGDNVLTYHSKYTFPEVVDMPRDWMPINATGDRMMVPVNDARLQFFSFNTTTGWQLDYTYTTQFRQVGLDRTGRIWGWALDKSYGTVHIINPGKAARFTVDLAQSSYNYTGTTINTTAIVNAYDVNNNRVVANVRLTLDGAMVFASTGAKVATVTTSASGATSVNVNIVGGGATRILAAVNN